MEYCLCIKPNDKNLLHIISRKDMRKAHFYAAYKIVATAADETEAFATAAALVQGYCGAHGPDDFSHFEKWVGRIRT